MTLVQGNMVVHYPDPSLTANVYCAGRLDEVIRRIVVPFWSELRRGESESLGFLWLVRYDKAGEHLKIRLHGPESWRLSMRGPLRDITDAYFASLGGQGSPTEERSRPPESRTGIPSIDPEDDAPADYADRSLVWTEYRRSPLSLGSEPLLSDDRYVSLLTRCLARACELTMEAVGAQDGDITHQQRQATLLKALASGIEALHPHRQKRIEYFRYHRDWLLRYSLALSNSDSEKELEILAKFQQQLSRMGKAFDALRRVVATGDGQMASREHFVGSYASWQRALFDLSSYVRPLCDDPAYDLDPFAPDPAFVPVFKAFHGLANQMGIDRLNEALAHHILFYAARGEVLDRELARPPVRVCMMPELTGLGLS